MRFQVPQFIETESKVVGPFTLKQFLFLAAGAVVIFILRYIFTTFFFWVVASLPVAILALGLAFYKINGVPLPNFIVLALSFAAGSKKYVYQQEEKTNDTVESLIGTSNPK